MSDRKTGATDAQIEAAARSHYHASVLNAKPWDLVSPRTQAIHRRSVLDAVEAACPPDQRIVPAALLEAVDALLDTMNGRVEQTLDWGDLVANLTVARRAVPS